MRRAATPLPLCALLVCALLAAPGCAPLNDAAGTFAGLDAVVMLPVFGRTFGDTVVSAITGRPCSVVRLEQGKSYCRPWEPPPPPPEFCTPSLGHVDCWAYPAALPDDPRQVADQPSLTPQQNANRTARWPNL